MFLWLTGSRPQVTTLVEYPPQLDLRGFVAGPQADAAGTAYALCGVVKHTGEELWGRREEHAGGGGKKENPSATPLPRSL